MSLLKRTSTVRCDEPGCSTEATIEHDLDMEMRSDVAYAPAYALGRAGWGCGLGENHDVCPICLAKKRVKRLAEQQRAEAQIEKKRRKGRKA